MPIIDDNSYGSMHVPTTEAIRLGLHSQEWLNDLLKTYTPLMAEQEIYAKHVNISGGRAYYAASEKNKSLSAPWGDTYPDAQRPLIVGCDFNFQPAPCVWVVLQQGPFGYEDQLHCFAEISQTQISTSDMASLLFNRFPGFFFEIYGDSSGNRGTTSNAGETDYNQISDVLNQSGAIFSIDVDQSNPRVKDRVENVNRLLINGIGEISLTYNPQTCPLLDLDLNGVGWKDSKLDDGGDKQKTHASDALGYALFKKRPPGKSGILIQSLQSSLRQGF
jgi:hypothetical protein